jgi:plasmid stabilization system protein ParE
VPSRVSTPAKWDVIGILEHLRENAGAKIALQFDHDLRIALIGLHANPRLGHRRRDLTARDFLFYGVYPYLVVYERVRNGVLVHAVLHGARDIESILNQRVF